MCQFIKKHFDFHLYPSHFIILAFVGLMPFVVQYAPLDWGQENHVIENAQLLVLVMGFVYALRVKVEKAFFTFVAMIFVLMFLREISWGRTIFLTTDDPYTFGRWERLPYGFLVLWARNLYIVGILIYFFWRKIYRTIGYLMTQYTIPVWTMMFFGLGVVGNCIGEKMENGEVLEEYAEFISYFCLLSLIPIYARVKIPHKKK